MWSYYIYIHASAFIPLHGVGPCILMSASAAKTEPTVDKTEGSRLPLRGLRLRHSYVGSPSLI